MSAGGGMMAAETIAQPLSDRAIRRGVALAETLFGEIGALSFDGIGYTRAPYGPVEQAAHHRVADACRALGLEVEVDAGLNLWARFPGRDPHAAVAVGSHLDSVPGGGNFDGLAGVLAGLAAIEALRADGIAPPADILLVATRGEENAWFACQHIGSRIATGLFDPALLDSSRRIDTGRTLGDHMAEAGADLAAIRAGRGAYRRLDRISAFLEVHIEQGPELVEAGQPLAIVDGIRGSVRTAQILCRGRAGHSGAVPRIKRRDAALATARLLADLEAAWIGRETRGEDLVVTAGILKTDPLHESVTTIPELTRFSLDLRSHSRETLLAMQRFVEERMVSLSAERGIGFDVTPFRSNEPVLLDAGLSRRFAQAAQGLGLDLPTLSSGAGHDVGDFVEAGIPGALLFIRNDQGSHNPSEHMDMSDFRSAVHVLATVLVSA